MKQEAIAHVNNEVQPMEGWAIIQPEKTGRTDAADHGVFVGGRVAGTDAWPLPLPGARVLYNRRDVIAVHVVDHGIVHLVRKEAVTAALSERTRKSDDEFWMRKHRGPRTVTYTHPTGDKAYFDANEVMGTKPREEGGTIVRFYDGGGVEAMEDPDTMHKIIGEALRSPDPLGPTVDDPMGQRAPEPPPEPPPEPETKPEPKPAPKPKPKPRARARAAPKKP